MSKSANSSIVDIITVSAGAVGIVATLVLTLVGVMVALQFWKGIRRIEILEDKLEKDQSHYSGLRLISQSVFLSLTRVTGLLEIERRQLTDILIELEKPARKRRKISSETFIQHTDKKLKDLSRITWYFQLMAMDKDDLSPLISIIEHYPDVETLNFLRHLQHIVDDVLRIELETHANGLERELLQREQSDPWQ